MSADEFCSKLRTVTIRTISLCWLPGNNRLLKWDKSQEPFPGYVNKIEELTKLNNGIMNMNRSNGAKAPHQHMFGIFGDHHRFSDWRESEKMGDQLHLSNKKMVKLGENVVKYFMNETMN